MLLIVEFIAASEVQNSCPLMKLAGSLQSFDEAGNDAGCCMYSMVIVECMK